MDHPWMFKDDLVMVADRTGNGLNRWTTLSLNVFWVQIHNVPSLSMTAAVAEAIWGLMGTVCTVDISVSRDCIGRFLRVRIRFNIREPLMRETFVNFPDDGRLWVDFKYEALTKYCLICGLMGHATRSCMNCSTDDRVVGRNSMHREDKLSFRGLDAVMDLRGNPLRTGFQGGGVVGSNDGSNSLRR